ncbi:hypothetical protein K3495_g2495 [Podosphaera aphanis]|nr:hypothetical protein K3495_g2495 [Podosphaera aphanis]
MLGIDYSEKSIEFAKRIGLEKTGREIEFLHWDIMSSDPHDTVLTGDTRHGWDVVLDKGTFDAISLSDSTDADGRRLCDTYRARILPLIRAGGIFLITSCNWTEEELVAWIQGPELGRLDAIRYKRFSFGGHTGQTISSVCFQKE